MSREIQCPRCHKVTEFASTNPYRPFCSERCKLIDLGQWAEEKYAIPVSQTEIMESSELDLDNKYESGDSNHDEPH